jgi:hypothetical protein
MLYLQNQKDLNTQGFLLDFYNHDFWRVILFAPFKWSNLTITKFLFDSFSGNTYVILVLHLSITCVLDLCAWVNIYRCLVYWMYKILTAKKDVFEKCCQVMNGVLTKLAAIGQTGNWIIDCCALKACRRYEKYKIDGSLLVFFSSYMATNFSIPKI